MVSAAVICVVGPALWRAAVGAATSGRAVQTPDSMVVVCERLSRRLHRHPHRLTASATTALQEPRACYRREPATGNCGERFCVHVSTRCQDGISGRNPRPCFPAGDVVYRCRADAKGVGERVRRRPVFAQPADFPNLRFSKHAPGATSLPVHVPHVVALRRPLEVIWVDAPPVIAGVHNDHPLWDWAEVVLERDPMACGWLVAWSSSQRAVPIERTSALPDPATGRLILHDPCHDLFVEGHAVRPHS